MRRIQQLLDSREPILVIRDVSDSVRSAVSSMARARAGIVAVKDGNRFVGVFSERDLLVRVVAKGLPIQETILSQVMTRDPLCARKHELVSSAVEKMQSRSIRHLPILDEKDDLIDMLSIRDLMRAQVREYQGDLRDLQNYVSGGFGAEEASA